MKDLIGVQLILIVLGFVMLVKGADWFVDGTSGIARSLGIPQLVIGLTIVAMGTSMPEAAVSIMSAIKGTAGIAVGNVVGSNILNILIILGVTACIRTLTVQKSTMKYEVPYMVVITIVLVIMGYTGNRISRVEGIILWILFGVYWVYLFRMVKEHQESEIETNTSMVKLIILSIVGILVIVLGSDITIDAATVIAKSLGVSERVIGLTIVAFGTSLPELVTSVTAARKGNSDIAIGNIVGSNIFNILFILGTASLIMPLDYQVHFRIDGVIAILAGVLLWCSVVRDCKLKKNWGILMLLCYGGYLVYLFI